MKIVIFPTLMIILEFSNIEALPVNTNNKYFQNPDEIVPEQFGILLMTQPEGSNLNTFLPSFQHFTQMDCPIISQINVIWENEKSPQFYNFNQNQQKWNKQVNIRQNTGKNLGKIARFYLPQNSQALVLLSIEGNNKNSCQELKKVFQKWRNEAVGSLGPLFSCSGQNFRQSQDVWKYEPKLEENGFMAVSLTSCEFISRHYLDLFYATSQKMRKMRQKIILKNNCDDIALNWIVSTFYPEFRIRMIPLNNQIQLSNNSKESISDKTYCTEEFTKIFGASPRFVPVKQSSPNQDLFYPLRQEIILAKKAYLDENYLKKKVNLIELFDQIKNLKIPLKQVRNDVNPKKIINPQKKDIIITKIQRINNMSQITKKADEIILIKNVSISKLPDLIKNVKIPQKQVKNDVNTQKIINPEKKDNFTTKNQKTDNIMNQKIQKQKQQQIFKIKNIENDIKTIERKISIILNVIIFTLVIIFAYMIIRLNRECFYNCFKRFSYQKIKGKKQLFQSKKNYEEDSHLQAQNDL